MTFMCGYVRKQDKSNKDLMFSARDTAKPLTVPFVQLTSVGDVHVVVMDLSGASIAGGNRCNLQGGCTQGRSQPRQHVKFDAAILSGVRNLSTRILVNSAE